jgi:polyferredoxin
MMTKVGRAPRLIAYDTEVNIKRRLEGLPPVYRFIRGRTLIYVGIIAITGAIMLYSLASRSLLGINVLHDRNPLFVALSDGSVRNAYTVRFLNKRPELRSIALSVAGVPHPTVHVIGEEQADHAIVAVGPDQTREVRVLVTVPPDAKLDKSTPVTFTARDVGSGETVIESEHFIAQ